MNKIFLEVLISWPKPYITGTDLHFILNKSADSRQGIIKRAIKSGYLIPIRRDLYLIRKLKNTPIDTFELAMLIYGPSYISFETALSYHGRIPEAVITITSATSKRTAEFETPIGFFSYEHIPVNIFSLGVEQHLQKNGVTLFIASPIKALTDICYARKKTWNSIEDLRDDLRIDHEQFQNVDHQSLHELINNYSNQNVKNTLKAILQGIN